MSSLGASSGAKAGAGDGPGRHERGRQLGSQNGARGLAATPPVPRKRGRPLGSRNKKTLAALAAAAAVEPFGASQSTALVAAPGGGAVVAAVNAAVPAAATSVAGLTGTPLEAAAALVSAAMAFGAAPPGERRQLLPRGRRQGEDATAAPAVQAAALLHPQARVRHLRGAPAG
jgi:hypothetical protein